MRLVDIAPAAGGVLSTLVPPDFVPVTVIAFDLLGARLLDEMVLNEEVGDALVGDNMFHADAVILAAPVDGRTPGPAAAIGALGQPHAAWPEPEDPLAAGEARSHLGAERGVFVEQRHIAVGRVGGEHLDGVRRPVATLSTALRRASGICRRDIAIDIAKLLKEFRVPLFPSLREVGHVPVVKVGLLEVFAILASVVDAILKVMLEAVLEVIVGELFEEDGGESHGELWPGVEVGTLVDHAQDGEICLGGRLVEPIFAVGPGAVPQHVGQVAVEHEAEGAEGFAHGEGDGTPRGRRAWSGIALASERGRG